MASSPAMSAISSAVARIVAPACLGRARRHGGLVSVIPSGGEQIDRVPRHGLVSRQLSDFLLGVGRDQRPSPSGV